MRIHIECILFTFERIDAFGPGAERMLGGCLRHAS